MLGEGVEQFAVGRRVEEAALLALALDLGKIVAELAQQPDACRLVIDKGAAAAVGGDDAAQHDRAGEIGRDAGLVENGRGGMIAADRELGGDGGLLGAGADKARIGAAAERQRQRIHQDRFAGAGLARQDAQPRPEREGQAFDQDDIAYREAEQHAKGLICTGVMISPAPESDQQGRRKPIGTMLRSPTRERRSAARPESPGAGRRCRR